MCCVCMCLKCCNYIMMMEYYLAMERRTSCCLYMDQPDNLLLSEISRIEKDDIVTEKNKSGILDLFILLCPSILKSFVQLIRNILTRPTWSTPGQKKLTPTLPRVWPELGNICSNLLPFKFISSFLHLCSMKETSTQTQGRRCFGTPVHHVLGLLAF